MMRWLFVLMLSILLFPIYVASTQFFYSINHETVISQSEQEPKTETVSTMQQYKPVTTVDDTHNVLDTYEEQLAEIEKTVKQQLKQLETEAKDELSQSSHVLRRGATFFKYEREARQIEAKADREFRELLHQINKQTQSDLVAKQLAEDLQKQYDKRKSSLKSQVFQEVNAYFNES
ncbi:MFS superfamily sulfate permease-like transporter [Alkalibacillus flavidus]|uniref:MFS superfamily sulfate permease-like transporter n=1 Tax=Alkalibacillus flavidus TaxID=546021 RepID=A0ABV2KTV6_9BACI